MIRDLWNLLLHRRPAINGEHSRHLAEAEDTRQRREELERRLRRLQAQMKVIQRRPR